MLFRADLFENLRVSCSIVSFDSYIRGFLFAANLSLSLSLSLLFSIVFVGKNRLRAFIIIIIIIIGRVRDCFDVVDRRKTSWNFMERGFDPRHVDCQAMAAAENLEGRCGKRGEARGARQGLASWLGGISFPRRLPANATLPPYRGRRRRCRHRRRRRRRFVFLRSLLPLPVPLPASLPCPASPPSFLALFPLSTHSLLLSSPLLSTPLFHNSAPPFRFLFAVPFSTSVRSFPTPVHFRRSPFSTTAPSYPRYFHQLLQRLLLFHRPEFSSLRALPPARSTL